MKVKKAVSGGGPVETEVSLAPGGCRTRVTVNRLTLHIETLNLGAIASFLSPGISPVVY